MRTPPRSSRLPPRVPTPPRSSRGGERRSSAHVDEIDDEDQRLATLDGATGAAVAVAQVRRDGQLAAAAHLHPLDALVPALDDHADTETEVQRRAAVPGGVELLARGVGDADV